MSGLLQAGGDLLGNVISGGFNMHAQESQQDWEQYMSNTAYQRAAADLEKAGLNRVLALGNAASTPGTSAASIDSPKLGTSYIQGASAKAQIEVANEQAELLRRQQESTIADTELKKIGAETAMRSMPNIDITGREMESRILANQAGAGLSEANVRRIAAELPRIAAETRMLGANASEAEFRKVLYEKFKPFVDEILKAIPTNSASAAGKVREDASNWLSDMLFNLSRLWNRDNHRAQVEN